MPSRAATHRFAPLLALAVVYVATAKLGLSLDPVGGFATLVWAPTGIALAALVRGGRGLWPAVLLGALAANVWHGAPLHTAFGIAFGNTLEAVLGAAVLTHVSENDVGMHVMRDAVALVGVALVGTMISASAGVTSLALSGVVQVEAVGATWLAWWLGDVLGALVVAPVLLCWSQPAPVAHRRSRTELIALAASALILALFAFSSQRLLPLRQHYVIFLPLMWAAIRFGPRVSTLGVFAVSCVAVAFTVHGVGPFALQTVADSLTALQAFMGFAAATTLLLAAASDERALATQEARHALATRDEFLAIASHELKTPLSSLALLIAGLQRETADGSVAVGRVDSDRLDRARIQVDRIGKLVDQLLDVSRLTAGRLELSPEPFDLSEAVRDLVGRMQDQAQGMGCALSVAANGPVRGDWDRVRIEQVVVNLLSNALKYGEGRPVEVLVESSGSSAVLRVRDRGLGIGAEDVPRIFGRFERAARASTHKGLGLGLYIARQVVDAHGGSIHVETASGVGSTFTVELPLSRRTSSRPPPPDA